MRPILVFGAAGQVGRNVVALAAKRGIAATGLTRIDVDITNGDAVGRAIAQAKPGLVVNAAAYTAVDRAETEPDKAAAANAAAPGILAFRAATANVAILHLSTDYVFNGTKMGAYTEDDAIDPLGIYGRTKADGESAVRANNPRHIILRTAWVYGIYGANFLKTMLRLAAERDRLRVVDDQHGCPTATDDLAEAILAVHAALESDPRIAGTFHFAGTGRTSWHGFADAIIRAQAPFTGREPIVEAITTADYPTPARRPANSVLDSSRFVQVFGYRSRPWQERTTEVVRSLVGSTLKAGA